MRDEEDENEVAEIFTSIVKNNEPYRRLVTCWAHEQRGVSAAPIAMDTIRKNRKTELVRWVPDGIKSSLVTLVNQVMYGELDLAGSMYKKTALSAGPKKPPGRPKKIVKEDDDSEGDYEPRKIVKRKRRRSNELMKTVRFVDGEEVLCEAEEWDGGCSLCGKAWLDSGEMESICCDECDQWFHFECVGIAKAPTGKFLCPKCA